MINAIADGIVVCQIMRGRQVVKSPDSCSGDRWCKSNPPQPSHPLGFSCDSIRTAALRRVAAKSLTHNDEMRTRLNVNQKWDKIYENPTKVG